MQKWIICFVHIIVVNFSNQNPNECNYMTDFLFIFGLLIGLKVSVYAVKISSGKLVCPSYRVLSSKCLDV